MNYVENANVVILSSPNSSASEDTTAQVQNLVLSLNSTADIFRLNDEKFNIEAIVGTGKFDLESFELSPSWKRVLIADRGERMRKDTSSIAQFTLMPAHRTHQELMTCGYGVRVDIVKKRNTPWR